MLFWYIPREGPYLVTIREADPRGPWEQMQRTTDKHWAEPGNQVTPKKTGRRTFKSQRGQGHQENMAYRINLAWSIGVNGGILKQQNEHCMSLSYDLCICYGCIPGCSCGTSNNRRGCL